VSVIREITLIKKVEKRIILESDWEYDTKGLLQCLQRINQNYPLCYASINPPLYILKCYLWSINHIPYNISNNKCYMSEDFVFFALLIILIPHFCQYPFADRANTIF
jgi:hypothetical protein